MINYNVIFTDSIGFGKTIAIKKYVDMLLNDGRNNTPLLRDAGRQKMNLTHLKILLHSISVELET